MTAKEILYKVKDRHNIGTAWQLTEHIIIEAMLEYAKQGLECCMVCGDAHPKHGFYPLHSMTTLEDGRHYRSSVICNRCARTDEDYHKIFGEQKQNPFA